MSLTAEQRSIRARAAALTRWSRENGRANAMRGQAGLRGRFRREVEAENPGLPPAELERRTDCRFRAHMAKLALKSSRIRTRQSDQVPADSQPPSRPPTQPERPPGPANPPKIAEAPR